MIGLFPQRPARATADLRRELSSYTTQVLDPTDPHWRDWITRNPWIQPGLLPAGDPCDERLWVKIETNTTVKGSMASRIAQLVGGGIELEPGEGDGASELYDYWSEMLSELPRTRLMVLALRAHFRGWEIFEASGAWRQYRPPGGSPVTVFAPVLIRDAMTWQFRWTVGRDLAYTPGGGLSMAGWRRNTLPGAMKWWTPAMGSLSNPYGDPLHFYAAVLDFAYRELSQAGLVAIKQNQGFLKAEGGTDLLQSVTEGDERAAEDAIAKLRATIERLQASGILWAPPGMNLEWVELVDAVKSWIELFVWFGDEFRSFYGGGNLTTQMRGSTGSRAASEVQERMGLRLSAVDAASIEESFRPWLRTWSSAVASVIAPKAFPGTAITPQIGDVPLRAVPHLSFTALHQPSDADRQFLETLSSIGVIDDDSLTPEQQEESRVRPDVRRILQLKNIPLLDPGEIGQTLDLTRKQPAPPGFPAASEEDIEADPEEEGEEDEDEDISARR